MWKSVYRSAHVESTRIFFPKAKGKNVKHDPINVLGPPTKSPSFSRSICWFGSTFFCGFCFCSVRRNPIETLGQQISVLYIFTVRSRYGFLDSTQVEKEETTSKGHIHTRSSQDVSLVGHPSLASLVKYGKCSCVCLVSLHPCEKPESFLRRPFLSFIREKISYFFRSHFELFRGGWGSSST